MDIEILDFPEDQYICEVCGKIGVVANFPLYDSDRGELFFCQSCNEQITAAFSTHRKQKPVNADGRQA